MTERRRRLSGDGGTTGERGGWSSLRKMEVVIRVLRGEDLDSLSREPHITAAAIAQWRDQFLAGGQAGLRRQETDERDLEISRTRSKIGEITMETALLRERARRAEAAHPFAVAEAEAVAATASPSAGKQYGLARVWRVLELARSTVDAQRQRELIPAREARKRGPRTAYRDGELTELIRGVLETSPWLGEGNRMVLAQLRARGIRTRRARVLRLMRQANLLAPTRGGHAHGAKAHDGTITTDLLDRKWGTDGTATLTGEGQVTIFTAVDHCTQECISIHSAFQATRLEALKPAA